MALGTRMPCALEISASFLAVPVRCVPGPREDACGREALGTRMRLTWKLKFD